MAQDPAIPSFIFRGHASAIHALHFFTQNEYLASGDSDGWVTVWSLASKRAVAVWKGHEGGVMAIQNWTEDRLISHGRDHFLRVWQLRPQDFEGLSTRLPIDGASLHESKPPWLLHSMAANALNYCAFSKCNEHINDPQTSSASEHDSILIATPNGLDAGGIDIFQLPSQHRVNKKPSSKDIQTGMVMSLLLFQHPALNQLMLVAGYESGHIMVYLRQDAAANNWKWSTLETLRPHSQPVLSLDITPECDKFVSSSADALIVKYAVPDHQIAKGVAEKMVNTKHAGQQDITIRDDSKIFATAGWDQRVRVYSMKTMKELAVLKWHQEGCYALAFASVVMVDKAVQQPKADMDSALTKTPTDVIKDKRAEQARRTHWLAAGGKDGKISLWDIY